VPGVCWTWIKLLWQKCRVVELERRHVAISSLPTFCLLIKIYMGKINLGKVNRNFLEALNSLSQEIEEEKPKEAESIVSSMSNIMVNLKKDNPEEFYSIQKKVINAEKRAKRILVNISLFSNLHTLSLALEEMIKKQNAPTQVILTLLSASLIKLEEDGLIKILIKE
jgi:hypothetical protein